MSVTMRRAGPQDAAKLSLVGGATFLESFAADHPGDDLVAHVASSHSVNAYAGWLGDPSYAAWIVEEAHGCPIGYALMGPPDLPETGPGDMQLKRIYMLSKWHGGGRGAALLSAVEEEAKARGAKRLALAVYQKNVSARSFYEHKGFTQISTTTFMVGNTRFHDFVMAKMIGS